MGGRAVTVLPNPSPLSAFTVAPLLSSGSESCGFQAPSIGPLRCEVLQDAMKTLFAACPSSFPFLGLTKGSGASWRSRLPSDCAAGLCFQKQMRAGRGSCSAAQLLGRLLENGRSSVDKGKSVCSSLGGTNRGKLNFTSSLYCGCFALVAQMRLFDGDLLFIGVYF